MLSESEKLNERRKWREMPELVPPVTVRLKFRKVGSLQYISHLDLQRTFNRVIVRACLPVWYTKGFNPHAKLVFSTPLSVGVQSEYEFLDIRFDRAISCEEIRERLNRELTDELCILDAYLPDADFSEIAYSAYTYRLHLTNASASLAGKAQEVLTHSPLVLTKKTKSGEREVDIVPLIRQVKAEYEPQSGEITMRAILRASVGDFLNPELLVTALRRECGILSGDPMQEWYDIIRTATMKEDMSLFR